VTEGSTYETEKEIERGKRKKVRNRFFDSDSDEEIIRRNNKKSIPLPSVPFKCASVKKTVQNKK